MSWSDHISSACLSSLDNPKLSGSITAHPSLGTEPWICRASRLGGCGWASEWSLRAGLVRRTTQRMNRCIGFIRQKWLRPRQARHEASSNARPDLFAITTTNVPMRRWSNGCPQHSIAKAGAAIGAGCRNCDIAAPGLRVGSRQAAMYAGADGCGSLVELSAGSVWVSSRYTQAFMRSISSAILLACWWTPIRAACAQLDGSVGRKQLREQRPSKKI